MKKVLLIFPSTEENFKKRQGNMNIPLGLATLKYYAKEVQKLDAEIEIIDGGYCSLDKIKEKIKESDMVCIQPMMNTYQVTLDMIQYAEECDVPVVLGGHYASQLAKEMVENRKVFVVRGQGERAFCELIKGEKEPGIKNLVYYDYENGEVKINDMEDVWAPYPIEIDPADMEQYVNINDKGADPYNNKTVRYTQAGTGCSKYLEPCDFCGRFGLVVKYMEPSVWVQQLRKMAKQGIKYIWEVNDDVLQNRNFVRGVTELLKEPNKLENSVELRIFARTDHIIMNPSEKISKESAEKFKKDTISFLKATNVKQVIIGFESADDGILKSMGKGVTAADNMAAAKFLIDNGIEPIVNYVLGHRGETSATLKKAVDQAKDLYGYAKSRGMKLSAMVGNILEIDPGSTIYKELLNAYPQKYKDKDFLEPNEMLFDYVKMTNQGMTDAGVGLFIEEIRGCSREIGEQGEYQGYEVGGTVSNGEDKMVNRKKGYAKVIEKGKIR